MPFVFSKNYIPPTHLSPTEKVEYSIQLVEKHRTEAKLLRKKTAQAQALQKRLENELERWKQKYQESQDQLKRAKQEIGELRKEKGKLEQEIERLTKTNSRYRVSLFDSGNFKSPDNEEKKTKGGQLNHADTNRENQANFPGYENFLKKRIYAKSCNRCGSSLSRVNTTKTKVLLDIVIKPEIIQMILQSERQWCKTCKAEVNAKDPQSLPFTEYGLNTFMMIIILRFKAHCSLLTTSKVIEISFGLTLSKSDVSNLLKAAAKYLGSKYDQLKQAVRAGEIIYADETGWLVRGQKAWMWIMTTEDTKDEENQNKSGITVYVAAESRGKGIAEDIYGDSQAKCMTDGLKSYTNTIPKDKHLYCWAHVLRFAFEETIHSKSTSDSICLRDELVRIYHIKQQHPEYLKEKLEQVLTEELDRLLAAVSKERSFQNIQGRLRDQKDGLIRALLETQSGTNNLGERELRPLVLGRKVSNGSDTYTGMETTAILSSIIQTLGRDRQKDLLIELTLNLQIGIHEKYPQYTHLACLNSS